MKHEDIEVRIGLYPFKVKFVPKEDVKGYDGYTDHNAREIKIRDDLDFIATILTLRHEITHALLGTQGRVYQRKFDLEEVCEFIAYKLPEIEEICDKIGGALYADECR